MKLVERELVERELVDSAPKGLTPFKSHTHKVFEGRS